MSVDDKDILLVSLTGSTSQDIQEDVVTQVVVCRVVTSP